MKRTIFALTAALSLSACAVKNPAEESTTRGHGIVVDTLFVDQDGCKVNRFRDSGRYRYYVVCPHADATVNSTYSQQSGKTQTVHEEQITTTAGVSN